jgi:hypothetical protein
VLEQERFALFGGEHAQRILDVSTHVRIDFRFRARRHSALDCIGRWRKPKLAPMPSRCVSPALVDDDLIKPAPEAIWFSTVTKTTKSTHEGRLQRIVRVDTRSKHSHRKPDARVLMAPNQAGECFNISCEDGGDQVCIRRSLHK